MDGFLRPAEACGYCVCDGFNFSQKRCTLEWTSMQQCDEDRQCFTVQQRVVLGIVALVERVKPQP